MRLDKKGNYISSEQLDEYYDEINVDKEYIYLTNSTYVNNKLSDYSLTVINKKQEKRKVCCRWMWNMLHIVLLE